jgi:hypothetical protein
VVFRRVEKKRDELLCQGDCSQEGCNSNSCHRRLAQEDLCRSVAKASFSHQRSGFVLIQFVYDLLSFVVKNPNRRIWLTFVTIFVLVDMVMLQVRPARKFGARKNGRVHAVARSPWFAKHSTLAQDTGLAGLLNLRCVSSVYGIFKDSELTIEPSEWRREEQRWRRGGYRRRFCCCLRRPLARPSRMWTTTLAAHVQQQADLQLPV